VSSHRCIRTYQGICIRSRFLRNSCVFARLARTGKQCEFFVPLSLGVAVAGGVLERLTRRGSAFFPAASTVLSTCLDNQRAALVSIYQGDRKRAAENRLLGEFKIDALPSASQGELQIIVTATLHPDGLLAVRAQCEKANILAGFDRLLSLPGEDPTRLSEFDVGFRRADPRNQENKAGDSSSSSSGDVKEGEGTDKIFVPIDPWEDRKSRCKVITTVLLPILGSDVAELIDQFDDLLRWSLCKAPSAAHDSHEGSHATSDLDGDDNTEDEDEDEDVALAPGLLPRF